MTVTHKEVVIRWDTTVVEHHQIRVHPEALPAGFISFDEVVAAATAQRDGGVGQHDIAQALLDSIDDFIVNVEDTTPGSGHGTAYGEDVTDRTIIEVNVPKPTPRRRPSRSKAATGKVGAK